MSRRSVFRPFHFPLSITHDVVASVTVAIIRCVSHHTLARGLTNANDGWAPGGWGQVDDDRADEAVHSGAFISAVQEVLARYGELWFANEAFVIAKKRSSGTDRSASLSYLGREAR